MAWNNTKRSGEMICRIGFALVFGAGYLGMASIVVQIIFGIFPQRFMEIEIGCLAIIGIVGMPILVFGVWRESK